MSCTKNEAIVALLNAPNPYWTPCSNVKNNLATYYLFLKKLGEEMNKLQWFYKSQKRNTKKKLIN